MSATVGLPTELTLLTVPSLLGRGDGWAGLRAAIQTGHAGGIDGAWGSSAAAAVAALAAETPHPLLVVVPHLTDVTPWAEDLAGFAGVRPIVFPAFETWPVVERAGKIAPETGQRLRVLQQLASGRREPAVGPQQPAHAGRSPIILAPIAAVVQPVPPPADLTARGRRIAAGDTLDPEEFARWLLDAGYQRAEAVEFPGEFARRGGILDLFPPDAPDPVRLEFFGDELESIRTFTAQTQRSLGTKAELTVLGVQTNGRSSRGFILDYFPPGAVVALVEPNELKEQAKHFFERVADADGLFAADATLANLMIHPTVTVSALPRPSVEATCHVRAESVERFSGNVLKVRDELDAIAQTDRVLIACQTDAEVHRLTEVLKAGKLAESDRLRIVTGHVRRGFRLVGSPENLTPRPPLQSGEGEFNGDAVTESPHAVPAAKGKSRKRPAVEHPLSTLERGPGGEVSGLVVIGSHELFHKELLPPGVKAGGGVGRRVESRAIDSFLELNDGDYVVHVAHGIARFRGMKMLEKGAIDAADERRASAGVEEHLILEFRDGVLLYVPASRIDLVQRYIGGQHAEPELSKLGGTAWGRKKDKVTEAVMDMAAEMIQIQAVRATLPGFAFPADSDWQREFEDAFPYQETPDQGTSVVEIKGDLEKPKPMDRLLCGDVGYGKTEVAIRAVFKAIDNGKQVAVLVPTTVLAEQHYRTFRERLAEYPFTVECLNRFRSPKQQKDIVKRLAEGTVDVVVGTHRLVSEGVKFKDLGLVVIDEEQRFGVEHKERLKRLRTSVHILTMTATPIPRTLHSALLGVREISSLETPPPERYPVETRIVRWDDAMIRNAIHRELNRGGQVYFVHNRVFDIWDVAGKLQTIVPEAKIVVGHGQMAEGELEQAMVKFVRKEADILVATTIIESGLDIPNANTIFIDDADQYGLADLHQLRGRVGRTKHRAYAYLIVNPLKLVSPNA
ncbi:MAG: DEAD/DEAH box helicase, partial [Gemmataceae bacterium]